MVSNRGKKGRWKEGKERNQRKCEDKKKKGRDEDEDKKE